MPLCAAVLLAVIPLRAQQIHSNSPDPEFGEVPDSLITMEEYAPFPDAPYLYAYKKLDISFKTDDRSIVAILDYHVIIKVFDGDAKQAALVGIPYYFENNMERITDIEGYTYGPEGGRTELDEEDIREININSRYNVKEFTMPAVTDGSVIEYRYRKTRRYIEELPDFYLAHVAPTAEARVSIRYPRYLRYRVIPSDFDGSLHTHTVRQDTSSLPRVFNVSRPAPVVTEHWTARDVQAVENLAYLSSINDYRGKLKFQLSEFGLPRQKLENSWDLVVAKLRKEQGIWDMIETEEGARALGREIASQFESPAAAQDSIYNYLNSNSRYNGARSPFSRTDSDSVLQGTSANQAAINQTLIAMLRGAGIEASPLLISTRQSGQINRSFPSFFQFNGQLVYSEIDGRGYFMDASFAHGFPNLIPVDTFNESGLLLDKNSYRWIALTPEKSLFSIRMKVDAELSGDGTLSGSVTTSNNGYSARLIREKLAEGQPVKTVVREALFSGYSEIELSDITVRSTGDRDRGVELKANFTIKNYARSFQDALEYRPMIVGYLMNNPFDQNRRNLPVTLDAPEHLVLDYQLTIPQGHSIDANSGNQQTELPGARLEEKYLVNGRSIDYQFHIDINRKQFEPGLYPQLLDLYERWVELSNSAWQIKRNS